MLLRHLKRSANLRSSKYLTSVRVQNGHLIYEIQDRIQNGHLMYGDKMADLYTGSKWPPYKKNLNGHLMNKIANGRLVPEFKIAAHCT